MTDVRAIQITKVSEEINGCPRIQARIMQRNPFWGMFVEKIWLTEFEWKQIGHDMGWLPKEQECIIDITLEPIKSCKGEPHVNHIQ